MSRYLSDNNPVFTKDKPYIKNFPLDDRHIRNILKNYINTLMALNAMINLLLMVNIVKLSK